MLPQQINTASGPKLVGTTSGSVPTTAYYVGGMALTSDGQLYVVFL